MIGVVIMRKGIVLAFLVSLSLVWVSDAGAITAWSRKYGADCSMCHWKQNKLNATGKEFLKRGHRMAGESAKTKDGAWTNISDYVSLTEKIRYQADQAAPDRPGFYVEALALYSGGPIDDKFSYFFEQYLHENNKAGADREKLAEAYLEYTSSDADDYWIFRLGQISPNLLHTHGTGGRLTISRPYVLESASFASNNPYAPRGRQYGVEIGANVWNTYGVLGIVNGTGHKVINPPGETNAAKDLYLTVEKVLDDNGSSVGFYGYKGTWSLNAADAATTGISTTYLSTSETNFYQLGLLGNYTLARISFVGGVLAGVNTPTGGTETNNLGYYVQGDLALADKLALFGRYDGWDGNTSTANNETQQIVAGLSIEPLSAGRVALEGQMTKTGTAAYTTKAVVEAQYMF